MPVSPTPRTVPARVTKKKIVDIKDSAAKRRRRKCLPGLPIQQLRQELQLQQTPRSGRPLSDRLWWSRRSNLFNIVKGFGLPPRTEAAEMRRAAMAPAVSGIWIVPNSLKTKSFSPKSFRSEVPEDTQV